MSLSLDFSFYLTTHHPATSLSVVFLLLLCNCRSIAFASTLLPCNFYKQFSTIMPSKAPKVESLSPDHWEKFPPPVDQELWKRYMNEDDSDSDASDTEPEGPMAGPSSASKGAKPDASEVKPISKNDLVSYLSLPHGLNHADALEVQ
jgi:hypothetical protein